jgi:uncharacterized protein with PQ loop repeat
MDSQTLSVVAGSISSLLFISANVPMLVKAYRTRNLRSYSLSNIVLVNVGNVLYWLYVSSFPPGPIWALHSFYTLTSAMMLAWYLRYERSGRTPS